MNITYGKNFLNNMNDHDVEKSRMVNLIDELLNMVSPDGSVYEALRTLRMDYLLLNEYSFVNATPESIAFLKENRAMVEHFINQIKCYFDDDSKKVVDVLLKNYDFQESELCKVGLGGKIKRLFLEPVKVG